MTFSMAYITLNIAQECGDLDRLCEEDRQYLHEEGEQKFWVGSNKHIELNI
jgi:hypothetical protein